MTIGSSEAYTPGVHERLQGRNQRRLSAGENGVTSYYESGHGYFPPARAGGRAKHFAIALATVDGQLSQAGDHQLAFPLHSVSKVFAYAQALEDRGREAVLRRVGVEPSGDAFNSITFDEYNRRPHNPMVNAGALAVSELILGRDAEEKLHRVLSLIRR